METLYIKDHYINELAARREDASDFTILIILFINLTKTHILWILNHTIRNINQLFVLATEEDLGSQNMYRGEK